jgi:hypothetical membrane protein
MSTTHEVRKHLRPQQRDETHHSPQRRRLIVALAAVGVVGIVVSAVVAVVLGLTRPGYSFVAEPVVALMSGPNAWMQDVNFVVLGVSVVAAAIGLHLAVRPSRWGAPGPALLALSGLGPVLAGVTAPVPVHFVVTFLGAGIGLIVLSRQVAHPSWDGLAGYVLATGIAILIVIPIHSVFALPAGAPLHPWWGLLNWSALALWVTCTAVLSGRLLRVARTT